MQTVPAGGGLTTPFSSAWWYLWHSTHKRVPTLESPFPRSHSTYLLVLQTNNFVTNPSAGLLVIETAWAQLQLSWFPPRSRGNMMIVIQPGSLQATGWVSCSVLHLPSLQGGQSWKRIPSQHGAPGSPSEERMTLQTHLSPGMTQWETASYLPPLVSLWWQLVILHWNTVFYIRPISSP